MSQPRRLELWPRLGQHATFVGKTGSGKTTTAVWVAKHTMSHSGVGVIALDTKSDGKLRANAHVFTSDPRRALAYPHHFVVYHPEGLYNTPEYLDAFLETVYERKRDQIILVDETDHVAPQARPDTGFRDVVQRMRERTLDDGRKVRGSVLTCSQRPVWIPRNVYTESTKFYIHRMSRRDRVKLLDYLEDDDFTRDLAQGHQFWLIDTGEGGTGLRKKMAIDPRIAQQLEEGTYGNLDHARHSASDRGSSGLYAPENAAAAQS